MIKGREVRLVGDKGEQLGIMPLYQAREEAKKRSLDIVEVAPTAVPPVCRLMDYGRFKYEQTKKEREARKSTKASLLKEVRMRPKIGRHDFEAKLRTARKQLDNGDKVKLTIMFRGRENTHPELGLKILKEVAELLKEDATVDGQPSRIGSRLHMILVPAKQKAKTAEAKEESKEKEDAKVENAQGS
jgi:translation initiation factor IF-3